MMNEWACCHDATANHQLPIVAAFWIIQIVSTEECSSLTQNLMRIHCSTSSVILHATATQYTCSLNGNYCPHWLVQWSRPSSHMCIPVHSPRLPGYMGVRRTILVTLTMAGIFPDRPHKYNTQMLDNIRIQRLIHKGYVSLTQNKPTTNKMLHQELVLKDLLAEWNKVSFPLT